MIDLRHLSTDWIYASNIMFMSDRLDEKAFCSKRFIGFQGSMQIKRRFGLVFPLRGPHFHSGYKPSRCVFGYASMGWTRWEMFHHLDPIV